MNISLEATNITVNDVDEALGCYRDALGLDVLMDVANGGFRWVTVASTAQPGLGIVLSAPHAGHSQAYGDALQKLLTKGVVPMLVFSTDDLDALFERVQASQVPRWCRNPSTSGGERATARSGTRRAICGQGESGHDLGTSFLEPLLSVGRGGDAPPHGGQA